MIDFSGIIKYILATSLAFMPALIWIDILKHHISPKQKWISGWLFLMGMLSALPILFLYYLWFWYNGIDLYDQIANSIVTFDIGLAIATMVAGSLEEVAKNSVVRYSDKYRYPIKTIGDAVKFSIFAALGFAFTENILYFANTIGVENFIDTFIIIVFRSVFTICAHLVFSGILGYYFSIAKFAQPFIEQEKWEGKKYHFIGFLHSAFGLDKTLAYRKIKMGQGLFIAAGLHALFNLLLHYKNLQYATLLVVGGFVFVYYLMTRKTGHIMLGYDKQRKSLMHSQDEDVVIELLGMWLSEGKYAEVESIAKRLLERDPDNKIVKIFLGKAHDRKKLINAYNALKALFSAEDVKTPQNVLEQKNEFSQSPLNKQNKQIGAKTNRRFRR